MSYNLAFYTCFYGSDTNMAFQIPELPSLKYNCYYYTNNNSMILKLKETKLIAIYDHKPTNDDLIESKKYIQYWVYDCPSHLEIFTKRMEFIKTLKLPNCCVLVPTRIVNNEDEVMELYKLYMSYNYFPPIKAWSGM